jgi:hypothetical protein
LHEVTAGAHAAARREVLKQRAGACLAFHRWEANAEILLDRMIVVGAVAVDGESSDARPRYSSAAPFAHS